MMNWLLARKLDRIGRKANPDRDFVLAFEKRIKNELNPKRGLSATWKLAAGSLTSLSLLLGGTGAYAYSSDAVLPDHPLYPVRERIENMEDVLAVTPKLRAAVGLKHVQRRLKERLLLNAQQKPVTNEQMQRFVINMEAAIEANGKLSEEQRIAFDRLTARVETAYTSSLVKAREQASDEKEKQKIDDIIETQTGIIDDHVETLQEKRKVQYQKLMERRQRIKDQRRLKTQDLPRIEENQLRELLPQRRIFQQPAQIFDVKSSSTLPVVTPTTTKEWEERIIERIQTR